MAWEHEKSGVTICLDVFRHLLVIVGTCYAVFLIWKLNWIIAMISAIPVYIIMLNLFGFISLPLYAFTPENRLKAKAFRSFGKGDFEKGKALTDEFTEKFNVKLPEELKDK